MNEHTIMRATPMPTSNKWLEGKGTVAVGTSATGNWQLPVEASRVVDRVHLTVPLP